MYIKYISNLYFFFKTIPLLRSCPSNLTKGEQSRAAVPPEDMQHALSLGCKGAAEGYVMLGNRN